MKRLLAFLLFAFCTVCLAQPPHGKRSGTAHSAPTIKRGATVYIEPMHGYESYLAAAFIKEHVPLVMVTSKKKADYIITGKFVHRNLNTAPKTVTEYKSGTSETHSGTPGYGQQIARSMEAGVEHQQALTQALGVTNASISVVNLHSSEIVFADSAERLGADQVEIAAEDCARHLKKFIEKRKKHHR